MQKKSHFKIIKKDGHSQARLGVLRTSHGKIQTPAYVMVATHGQIKTLRPSDIKKTKTQVVIANTYHLWPEVTNGNKELKIKNKGKTLLLKKLGTKIPTMTDSGGFQVFSLGAAKEHGVGKVLKQPIKHSQPTTSSVKFTEKGAYFFVDGKRRFLSPEISMDIQHRLGADIIFAFDECTSPLHPFNYQKKSMERTHRWAVRSLKSHNKNQIIYGIIQGGRFKSLRKASAKFISSLSFDGIAVGGSFGKDEMVKTLKEVVNYLPEDKPRHLLGIGSIRDIFSAVESGMDTFDCVIPTREARHGKIYTSKGPYDIRKSKYAKNNTRLEKRCKCPACNKGMTRTKLHGLFKKEARLRKLGGLARHSSLWRATAGRQATLHNVYFFNNLLESIRRAITDKKFKQFKTRFLTKFR